MMSLLRGLRRHLAALLLIASPAVGGQLMPLVHPCPVETPWAAPPELDAPAADHGAHAHAAHGVVPEAADTPAPTGHDGHTDCTCIGACAAPVALEAPAPGVLARVALGAPLAGTTWIPVALTDGPGRPHDRLPPQTAPPTA